MPVDARLFNMGEDNTVDQFIAKQVLEKDGYVVMTWEKVQTYDKMVWQQVNWALRASCEANKRREKKRAGPSTSNLNTRINCNQEMIDAAATVPVSRAVAGDDDAEGEPDEEEEFVTLDIIMSLLTPKSKSSSSTAKAIAASKAAPKTSTPVHKKEAVAKSAQKLHRPPNISIESDNSGGNADKPGSNKHSDSNIVAPLFTQQEQVEDELKSNTKDDEQNQEEEDDMEVDEDHGGDLNANQITDEAVH
ncbi:hypothetical protein DXG03_005646 [Asterophora parasitica]|uniref:Uncharacterized protein n=1 Tax=Asterophora parasitica TaxID=117018 RepID=A0A9P7G679_9AGAR|nr:hypothetical protein DXG03_005646 [Asterophora parasitica]